ncbi:YitT family protein [Anaerobacillus alkaliphilus]|uniref:YitT family protein n=1 Tax=Anaerobacillus alkaliphilus TaxID=1548597 RepID=A0A4Q0VYA8_9BACI|nr:YitT family protein [Anaerobacillus alkaliphilus]RXJ04098.1 YitT family protein [Anaerobacillus alkaliphilus]
MLKKLLLIFLGCAITSFGVILLQHSNVVTGGTAGLSLSASYLFGLPFAVLFFIINLPFYIFSVLRMGWKFTLSTVFAVTTLSVMTGVDQWLPHFTLPMWFGAIAGGFVIGIGLSLLFINGASLGGFNILALFLQKRYGSNPGKTTLIFDAVVVLTSIVTIGFVRGLFSIISIAVTAKVISYFKNQISSQQKADEKEKQVSATPTRKQVPIPS